MKKFLAAVAVPVSATLALSTAAVPASAHTADVAAPAPVSSVPLRQVQLSRAMIDRFDPFVSMVDGRYVLSSAAVGTPAELRQVREVIARSNAELTTGRVTVTTAAGQVTMRVRPGMHAMGGSHGGFSSHWYGYEIWLDNWATNRLVALATTGAGAALVAAELFAWTGIGGLSGAAIAAILALAAGGLMTCNWNDNGVGIHYAWTGTIWCWPR